MDLKTTRKRLHGWIDLLTPEHRATGRLWYVEARAFAVEVSQAYEIDLDRVVGVIACLSVQNRWDINKRDAEALIRAHYEGEVMDEVSVATYSSQKEKAITIILAPAGAKIADMIATKYGPKTRAFYDNILNPSTSYRVTIDRWILRGLDLEAMSGGGGNRMIKLYRELEEEFRRAALLEKMVPCELQAAMWVCIQQTASVEHWEGSRPGTGLKKELPV